MLRHLSPVRAQCALPLASWPGAGGRAACGMSVHQCVSPLYSLVVGMIPERHRPAVNAALEELVEGRRPDLLGWVRNYGESGAELVTQPEAIWDHPLTDYLQRDDGTAAIVVPLWTVEESPSDLSAECEMTAAGAVELTDVHVL